MKCNHFRIFKKNGKLQNFNIDYLNMHEITTEKLRLPHSEHTSFVTVRGEKRQGPLIAVSLTIDSIS